MAGGDPAIFTVPFIAFVPSELSGSMGGSADPNAVLVKRLRKIWALRASAWSASCIFGALLARLIIFFCHFYTAACIQPSKFLYRKNWKRSGAVKFGIIPW